MVACAILVTKFQLLICCISFSLSIVQFDAPEDTPNVRQYCLCAPEKSEISVHNCHFTNTSFCGACIYVHGEGARPWITHCTISNANNVGIFVDDHAQVRNYSVTHTCKSDDRLPDKLWCDDLYQIYIYNT